MTITVPEWLLYLLYAIGGISALSVAFVVGAFAFVGWVFAKTWGPLNW